MNAGEVIYTVHLAQTLAPWAGLGVFCGHAAALLARFIMNSRRDA
jgi:hypothetical protein